MKKRSVISLLIVSLTFLSCFTPSDDYSNRNIFLEVQDAMTFENNGNYSLGDTIYVEVNFNRYLDEAGYSNKLDIYESTGADSFDYNFRLEQYSIIADEFRFIDIAPNFIFSEKGSISEFGDASADLNNEKSGYESRIGVILAEAGRFRLYTSFFYLDSDNYEPDRVSISIENVITNTEADFEFVVTE